MQHFHTSLHGDVNLSETLYEECTKKNLDYNQIEELLKQGANPIGIFKIDTRRIPCADVVYGEILDHYSFDDEGESFSYKKSEESDDDRAYNITKLFLDYGMKITKDAFPNDTNIVDIINPLWHLAWFKLGTSTKIIKLLLDYNLDLESLYDLFDHLDNDATMIASEYFEAAHNYKLIMYLMSFEEVKNHFDYVKKWIDCEHNNYDLSLFRNILDYYVKIDDSERLGYWNNQGLILSFYKLENDEKVWTLKLY